MECNKDEAYKAKKIAVGKMQGEDFVAAHRMALKAQRLFPELENIAQLLSVCEVQCAALQKLNGEMDWYKILQLEIDVDSSMIKKQYYKLALLVHPDKNEFPGAKSAFMYVQEAHKVLCDSIQRSSYDARIRVHKTAPCSDANKASQETVPSADANKNVPNTAPSSDADKAVHKTAPSTDTNKTVQKTAPSHDATKVAVPEPVPSKEPSGSHKENVLNTPRMFTRSQASPGKSASKGADRSNPFNIPKSVGGKTFVTLCPHCCTTYHYNRMVQNKVISCQNCLKRFFAWECKVQAMPSSSKLKNRVDASSRQGFFKSPGLVRGGTIGASSPLASENIYFPVEKRVNDTKHEVEGHNTSLKKDADQKAEKDDAKHAVDSSRPSPSNLRTRMKAVSGAKMESNTLYKEETDQKIEKEDANCTVDTSKPGSPSNVNTKKRRVMFLYDDSVTEKLDSETQSVTEVSSRSTRRRQNPSLKENGDNVNDKGSPGPHCDTNAGTGRSRHRSNLLDKPDTCKKDPGETRSAKQAAANVDENFKTDSCETGMVYPDPEFFDFSRLREQNRFACNQIWALYDDLDGMPRFYARILHVYIYAAAFKLHIGWLEHDPATTAEIEWADKGMFAACGNFVQGTTDMVSDKLMFSHMVHEEKGRKRNSYVILPQKGEVWAIYKERDFKCSLENDNRSTYHYDVVEVLQNLNAEVGISVIPLIRIQGFVSLFGPANPRESFFIPPSELLTFSHMIPSYRISRSGREGVPKGTLELDCASLPGNLEEAFPCVTIEYYQSKVAKIHGQVHSSPLCGETSGERLLNSNKGKIETALKTSAGDSKANDSLRNKKRSSSRRSYQLRPPTSVFHEYPESDFYQFDEIRSADKFERGQIWALYSDLDKFPKYYCYIRKVEENGSCLHALWLGACPTTEEEKRWLQQDLPQACGRFKVFNDTMSFNTVDSFSHMVEPCLMSKRNQYEIFPNVGEIWAIYRGWEIGWTLKNIKHCKYDIVQIRECTDISAKVSLLCKVAGYRTVFRPAEDSAVLVIPQEQSLMFSHQIPAFSLTEECSGTLGGFWDLDSAAIPDSYLQ